MVGLAEVRGTFAVVPTVERGLEVREGSTSRLDALRPKNAPTFSTRFTQTVRQPLLKLGKYWTTGRKLFAGSDELQEMACIEVC